MNTIGASAGLLESSRVKSLHGTTFKAKPAINTEVNEVSSHYQGFSHVEKIKMNDISMYSVVENYSQENAMKKLLGFSIYV